VAESSVPLVELLTWFEGRHVTIHLAYNRVMDLLAKFSDKSEDSDLPEWQHNTYNKAAANTIVQTQMANRQHATYSQDLHSCRQSDCLTHSRPKH